jgi:hypothetical protein
VPVDASATGVAHPSRNEPVGPASLLHLKEETMLTELHRTTALALIVTASLAGTAGAEPARAEIATPPLYVDVEIDPAAYLMSGYSVHAGAGRGRARLEVGVYAMELPEWFHGNEGWDVSFGGAGMKVQYFLLEDQRGAFVDVGASLSVRELVLRETGARHDVHVKSLSASFGYRVDLAYGFYATPWVGVSYDVDDTEAMLDGETFEMSRISPFAAVHIGYRAPL